LRGSVYFTSIFFKCAPICTFYGNMEQYEVEEGLMYGPGIAD